MALAYMILASSRCSCPDPLATLASGDRTLRDGFDFESSELLYRQLTVSDNVGQSVCRLPMMIALIALLHYLASSITIMYISSPFPIDPRSSRHVLQSHLTYDRYPYSLRYPALAAGHPNPLQLFIQPRIKYLLPLSLWLCCYHQLTV